MPTPVKKSEQVQAPEDGAEVFEVPLLRTDRSEPSFREAVCKLFWEPGDFACNQVVPCRSICLEPVRSNEYEPQARPMAVHALPIKRRIPIAEFQATDPATPERLQSTGDAPVPASISTKKVDTDDTDLLVPLAIARGFVSALEARYVSGDVEAVDNFLQNLQPLPHVSILHQTEKVVSRSQNPAQTIAKLIGKWGLEETTQDPSAPLGNTDLLVPLEVAQGFVSALEARYLGNDEEAVDIFLQNLPPLPNVDILHQAEKVVRRSQNPAKTIARLIGKWGLEETAQDPSELFGRVLPLRASDAGSSSPARSRGQKECATLEASPLSSAEDQQLLPDILQRQPEEGQSFLAWSAPRTTSVASEGLDVYQSGRSVATPMRNRSSSPGLPEAASSPTVQTGEATAHAFAAPRTASVASEDLPDLSGLPRSYHRRSSSGGQSASPSRSPSRTPSRRAGSRTPGKRGPGSLGPLDVVFDFVGDQIQDIKRGPSFIPGMTQKLQM